MKAINHYVVVEKIKEGPKKVSGLILTDDTDTDNRYKKGKVVSVGNLVEIIKENDIIFYDKHAGHDISYNETIHKVIKGSDIVLVE
jgi:co-chaperonin GroES (HSP10)